MRAQRFLLGLLLGSLVVPASPPVHAAGTAKAGHWGLVAPDDDGITRVVLACTGQGESGDAARVLVICEIFDGSGRPSIRRQRSAAGAACGCVINAFNLVMPITTCSTAIVTFSDLSTAEDVDCKEYLVDGQPPAPRNPTNSQPRVLDCVDPVGTGV